MTERPKLLMALALLLATACTNGDMVVYDSLIGPPAAEAEAALCHQRCLEYIKNGPGLAGVCQAEKAAQIESGGWSRPSTGAPAASPTTIYLREPRPDAIERFWDLVEQKKAERRLDRIQDKLDEIARNTRRRRL